MNNSDVALESRVIASDSSHPGLTGTRIHRTRTTTRTRIPRTRNRLYRLYVYRLQYFCHIWHNPGFNPSPILR